MTKREQRLLLVTLTLLALVVDLRLLLLPAMERRAELREELRTLTQQQAERLRRMERVEDLATAAREAALAEATADYYPYLTTEEMDTIVTGLLLRHGFFPEELRVEEGRAGTTGAYLSGKREKTGGTYDGISLSSLVETGTAEDIAQRGQTAFYTASASFAARGSREGWMALLDDLEAHYPALRAASFTMEDHGAVEGTLVFSMYAP